MRAPAQAVGSEFPVNSYTSLDQRNPRVASDPSGRFVVMWESVSQDGSFYGVFGQRVDSAGMPLGAEFRVNTYTTRTQWSASVASESSGGFVVVWESYLEDASLFGIFGQRYASTGAPLAAEFRVNSSTTYGQYFPSVATDSDASFVVVWQSSTPGASGVDVFGQRFGSTGALLGPEFRVNAQTTDVQGSPSVASGSGGGFVVVWQSFAQDGSSFGIFGQRFASTGTPLSGEFRVNSHTTNNQTLPWVAQGSGGAFVVAWQSDMQDGSAVGIFAQRFASTGAPLGGEFRVNAYTTDIQLSPSAAVDSAGAFVVVWQSFTQDGSGNGIFVRRYSSAGTPLGADLVVNTFTTNTQISPTVAIDSSGRFVVVWQGYQSASPGDIFGQRFCGELPLVTPPPPVTATQTLCS